ncbi:MAG: OmpA family protein [Acidocella sp.]|uniref:OmpA family protein n=1 Tax=Acidocella sp. TaxID=50710 RepID=UPI003FC599A0
MKHVLLLAGLVVLAAPCADAQVAVNPAALQQLAGIAPAPAPAAPQAAPPAPHIVHHHHAAPPPAAAKPALPVPAVAKVAAPPPAPPAAAPVAPKPLAPVRLSFAPGSVDLPPNAADALKPFCTAGGMISIDAHAPATPSDPSVAMRLSLSRALAVKNALAACGVPAQNIVPRAMGATPGQANDQTIVAAGAGAAK